MTALTTITTIVVYTGPVEDTFVSEAKRTEVDGVKVEIELIEGKIENFNARVDAMDNYFHDKHTGLFESLSDMVKELRARRASMQTGEQYVPPVKRDVEDLLDEHGNPTEELLNETRKHEAKAFKKTKPSDRIKKLYRDIAMKCHPDRTTKADLHEWFKKAYQAYRSNDM